MNRAYLDLQITFITTYVFVNKNKLSPALKKHHGSGGREKWLTTAEFLLVTVRHSSDGRMFNGYSHHARYQNNYNY